MPDIMRTNGDHLLRVRAVTPSEPTIETWKYGEIWQDVEEIAIELGAAHWYGQGGLTHQVWPLEGLAQYEAPFITSDNGGTGLTGILHPFWFNSDGAGVLIEKCDHLITSFNAPLSGSAPAQDFHNAAPYADRPPLADGLETDGLLRIKGAGMQIRFFTLSHAREVVEGFWRLINLPPAPPGEFIRQTLWTTWAQFKNDIDNDQIYDLALHIAGLDFNSVLMGIDAKWQAEFGAARFDPAKFPNPQETLENLQVLGFEHVTLWAIPFFHPETDEFKTAAEKGYLVKGADGQPILQKWWEGEAGLLNVTSPDALNWHLDNLAALQAEFGLSGFKFDAGEAMFYDLPNSDVSAAGNRATHAYVSGLAERYPWSDARSGWFNQSAPMLFRQWDKESTWGYDNGLASCITGALTLNMLGYPYSFPDMIGGNQYRAQPSAELLIRWTQAIAPMPIIQFSIAPWDYGEECAQICAHYARIHTQLAIERLVPLALRRVPIVRPLWWLVPTDETAQTCADQYLIGDDLLVAPVIIEGARSRDVYLPEGRWRSYWNKDEIHQGNAWLRDYPAPLEVLPLFERIRQVTEQNGDES